MDFLLGLIEASFVVHNLLIGHGLDESFYVAAPYMHEVARYPLEAHGADLPKDIRGNSQRELAHEYFATHNYFRHVVSRLRCIPKE